jgi:hypothetical protein
MMKAAEEIPLTMAAYLIKRDYQWTRSRVLRGEIAGRQVQGRWLVDKESALRLRADGGKVEVAG